MVSVHHEWLYDYLIVIYSSCLASASPYLARVDGISLGYFSSFDDALNAARSQCSALHDCSLLERG